MRLYGRIRSLNPFVQKGFGDLKKIRLCDDILGEIGQRCRFQYTPEKTRITLLHRGDFGGRGPDLRGDD